MAENSDLELIKAHISSYRDFPKPGIMFRDMLPLFQNVTALNALERLLVNHVKISLPEVEAVVALDARGFLLGPIVATRCGIPLSVVRKKGKLPGAVKSVSYQLEYGEATFEIQASSISKGQKVLLIDDLLATGGSANAACELIKSLGGEVIQLVVVIELLDLKGREKLPCPVHSLVTY